MVGVGPSSSSRPGRRKSTTSSEQFDDSPHSFGRAWDPLVMIHKFKPRESTLRSTD
ncbi:hypothetical protein Syun_022628 [Stephania yunnanensis]|uniref:Uncharacterized protein n=1 Tax=Stephania yunnanensis TaxID=152371 RepID=A0AAP0I1N4_9MAGN